MAAVLVNRTHKYETHLELSCRLAHSNVYITYNTRLICLQISNLNAEQTKRLSAIWSLEDHIAESLTDGLDLFQHLVSLCMSAFHECHSVLALRGIGDQGDQLEQIF